MSKKQERAGARINPKSPLQKKLSNQLSLKENLQKSKFEAATFNGYAYIYFPELDELLYIENELGELCSVREKQWNYKPKKFQTPPPPDKSERRFLALRKAMLQNFEYQVELLQKQTQKTQNANIKEFNQIVIQTLTQ